MTTAVMSTTEVRDAVASVFDPEYPGVSIVDLGLLEDIRIDGDRVEIDLVPTFSGCPALRMIVDDVRAAVAAVPGVAHAEVRMVTTPVWTPARISATGRAALADTFTVAVQIGQASVACPRCGGATRPQSLFGPTRCRSVHRCSTCDEVVEVIR